MNVNRELNESINSYYSRIVCELSKKENLHNLQKIKNSSWVYFTNCIYHKKDLQMKAISDLEKVLEETGIKNVDADSFAQYLITDLYNKRKK